VGNPGLEPWTADSFHLSIDTYNLKKGHGSLGVYRRYVSNFFAQRFLPVTDEALAYYNIPEEDREFMISRDYQLRRWENVGDAHLTGLELSYRQDITILPDWLQKMQAWVNYTHQSAGGRDTQEFLGFTPKVYSVGLNYIRPRFAMRLTAAHQGETKISLDYNPDTSAALRYPPETYTYLGDYTRYGMSAEYAFSKRFVLFANWDNVFAKDRYYYRRGPDTPPEVSKSRRYVNPSAIKIGVKGTF
jgi:outer membrane receptor for ferrienterochelin and colicin